MNKSIAEPIHDDRADLVTEITWHPYPAPEPCADLLDRVIVVVAPNEGLSCKDPGAYREQDRHHAELESGRAAEHYLWVASFRCEERQLDLPAEVHDVAKDAATSYQWIGRDDDGKKYKLAWYEAHHLGSARWAFVPRSLLSVLRVLR